MCEALSLERTYLLLYILSYWLHIYAWASNVSPINMNIHASTYISSNMLNFGLFSDAYLMYAAFREWGIF
jgi:hypothetical protein